MAQIPPLAYSGFNQFGPLDVATSSQVQKGKGHEMAGKLEMEAFDQAFQQHDRYAQQQAGEPQKERPTPGYTSIELPMTTGLPGSADETSDTPDERRFRILDLESKVRSAHMTYEASKQDHDLLMAQGEASGQPLSSFHLSDYKLQLTRLDLHNSKRLLQEYRETELVRQAAQTSRQAHESEPDTMWLQQNSNETIYASRAGRESQAQLKQLGQRHAARLAEAVDSMHQSRMSNLLDPENIPMRNELDHRLEQPQDTNQQDEVTNSPPIDDTELAHTAGQLLEKVADNQSEKFQQSSFLALMRPVSYTHLTLPTKRIV